MNILKLIKYAPYWVQDLAITFYNTRLYRQRHAGVYKEWWSYFASMSCADSATIQREATARLDEFIRYVGEHSPWYKKYVATTLSGFPVLEKKEIIERLGEIITVDPRDAVVSLTGGTTGASMRVFYTPSDVQERFALVDHFRHSYGYVLGTPVAWFSGKDLASQADVVKGRCYRDDLINKVRFFSTFHITEDNFNHYWAALERFRPKYMVGFPSSIYDIAVMAEQRGLKASYEVQAVFANAEALLQVHRDVIGEVFSTRVVDQYGSAEGAPLILECSAGRLHLQTLSGVFEVIDSEGKPAREGELLVTSFSTRGTPLVRYRIGDRIKLAAPDAKCTCGASFPLVDWIDGRNTDFVWSPENGRINQANIANSTKGVQGIHCFQIVQDELDSIKVLVVSGHKFDSVQEENFLRALHARTGDGMKIDLHRVADIPRERSGKFRFVKNSVSAFLQP